MQAWEDMTIIQKMLMGIGIGIVLFYWSVFSGAWVFYIFENPHLSTIERHLYTCIILLFLPLACYLPYFRVRFDAGLFILIMIGLILGIIALVGHFFFEDQNHLFVTLPGLMCFIFSWHFGMTSIWEERDRLKDELERTKRRNQDLEKWLIDSTDQT